MAHVMIIGCGRAGSALAARLAAERESVAVVDRDPAARDLLPSGFKGEFVTGDGLSRPVLEEAGIGRAGALVALTSSDSLNLVIARTARDVFHVPRVVGRIQDTETAPLGVELGLSMVTPVRMTVDRVHRMLRHSRLEPEHTFGNGESLLVRSPSPDYLAGRGAAEFDVPGEIRVVEITRGGHSFIPTQDALLRRGDLLTFVVASKSLGRLRGFLGGRWN
jgi:trk system potassium uptake protein